MLKTKDNILITEIAKILLTQECNNWCWGVVSDILKNKYLKQAEQIYDKLVEAGWRKAQ